MNNYETIKGRMDCILREVDNMSVRRFKANRCEFKTHDAVLVLMLAEIFNLYPWTKTTNEYGWEYIYRYERLEDYRRMINWYKTTYQPHYKEMRDQINIEDARILAEQIGDTYLMDKDRYKALLSDDELTKMCGH